MAHYKFYIVLYCIVTRRNFNLLCLNNWHHVELEIYLMPTVKTYHNK